MASYYLTAWFTGYILYNYWVLSDPIFVFLHYTHQFCQSVWNIGMELYQVVPSKNSIIKTLPSVLHTFTYTYYTMSYWSQCELTVRLHIYRLSNAELRMYPVVGILHGPSFVRSSLATASERSTELSWAKTATRGTTLPNTICMLSYIHTMHLSAYHYRQAQA